MSDDFTPHRRLAVAVLLKALSDYTRGETLEIREEAWGWIQDREECDVWVKAAGLEGIWPPTKQMIERAKLEAKYDIPLRTFFYGPERRPPGSPRRRSADMRLQSSVQA